MSKKELKFIHITKTGGTSIEDEGKNHNIDWGRNHEEEYGWWHEIFIDKPQELKDKYDWFLAVRNPYERILSEFHCEWGGLGDKAERVGIKTFNYYLMHKIKYWARKTKTKHGVSRGDHYTPQHLYLDESVNTHILKMENLNEDFNNLMNQYNLDIKLTKKSNTSKKHFSLNDMDYHLVQLIQEVYHEDFERFGYSKELPVPEGEKHYFTIGVDVFNNEIEKEKEDDSILFFNYKDNGGKRITCQTFHGGITNYVEVYNPYDYPKGGLKEINKNKLTIDTVKKLKEKIGDIKKYENEKIAFCFLTYGDMAHSHIWEKFLKGLGEENYNLYIHPKEIDEVGENFKPYIIKDRVETEWGDISLVRATNNMFKEALKDKENKVFILLSDSCIPIQSPSIVKEELLGKKENRLGLMGDLDEERRYELIKNKNLIKKEDFCKRSQWMSLNRDTVKKVLRKDRTFHFEDVFAPDEVYYPTMLNMLGIEWVERTITFSNWKERSLNGKHRMYPSTYEFISFNEIDKIREEGALFMRKVDKDGDFEIYNIY